MKGLEMEMEMKMEMKMKMIQGMMEKATFRESLREIEGLMNQRMGKE